MARQIIQKKLEMNEPTRKDSLRPMHSEIRTIRQSKKYEKQVHHYGDEMLDDISQQHQEDDLDSEQFENARFETERVLKELERQGSANSTISRYFREMSYHKVLSPEREVEAAKKIEALEINYWKTLFSYHPCFKTVAVTIEKLVEEPLNEIAAMRRLLRSTSRGRPTKAHKAKWDKLSEILGKKLKELDSDRLFVQEVHMAVKRLKGENAYERDIEGEEVRLNNSFLDYLERVAKANREQQKEKNKFVSSNLRLVVSIARRYNRGRLPLIDLIQEGNFGLMKAVERFDHNRGYRFSTYASWWIRHAISRALADKGRSVRIPVHMLDTYNRVTKATQTIATRTGKVPSSQELEKETGIAANKLDKIKGYWAETPFSLDRTVNDEDGRKFIDFLEQDSIPSPHDQLVNERWSHELGALLSQLSTMEECIIKWRFGLYEQDELTLKEIGDKYNLSRERIRQLQEQALCKMRRQLQEQASINKRRQVSD